jgi:hypothetical protein
MTTLLLALSLTTANPCSYGFAVAERFITHLSVSSAVYGDFNEDGLIDVAFMDGTTRTIALNRGGGVFEPVSFVDMQSAEPLVAATDVDGDGHIDLVYRGSTISVTRGNGDGTFGPRIISQTPSPTTSWRLIDFDHDGRLDFVDAGDTTTFLRSMGDGTFKSVGTLAMSHTTFAQQTQYTSGDFDGDGFVDAFRAQYELQTGLWSVTIAWNGAGTSSETTAKTSIDLSSSLFPVDIDGDGKEELVGLSGDTLIVIRAADRKITFDTIPFRASNGFRNPIMADVNNDGRPDLLYSAGQSVGVAIRMASGAFAPPLLLDMSSSGLTLEDVDGDGIRDVVTTQGHDGLTAISGAALRSGSDEGAAHVIGTRISRNAMQIIDVNGDGLPDVVVSDSSTPVLRILYADGRGGFTSGPLLRYSTSGEQGGWNALVGDFDGDGNADLAISSQAVGLKRTILFGDGHGTFGPAALDVDVDQFVALAATGSGSPPALVALRGSDVQLVTISPSRIAQSTKVVTLPTLQVPITVATVDADGDGRSEIVWAPPDTLHLVKKSGGIWSETATLAMGGEQLKSIAAADIDGDGRRDLVVMTDLNYRLWSSTGDGGYRLLPSLQNVHGFPNGIAVADFDRDGTPDLVVWTRGNFGDPGMLQVYRGTGGGAFQPYASAATGAPIGALAVSDINGDGIDEYLLGTFDGIEILRSVCVTPRVRVAAVPHTVNAGARVRLIVYALSTDAFGVGPITISEGKTTDTLQAWRSNDDATATWTSPPLAAGRHTFIVTYNDHYAGPSQTTVTVDAAVVPPRSRSVHH